MSLFTVTLRPEPGDTVPPEVRLKVALKRLRRAYRLIAVDVRESVDPADARNVAQNAQECEETPHE